MDHRIHQHIQAYVQRIASDDDSLSVLSLVKMIPSIQVYTRMSERNRRGDRESDKDQKLRLTTIYQLDRSNTNEWKTDGEEEEERKVHSSKYIQANNPKVNTHLEETEEQGVRTILTITHLYIQWRCCVPASHCFDVNTSHLRAKKRSIIFERCPCDEYAPQKSEMVQWLIIILVYNFAILKVSSLIFIRMHLFFAFLVVMR